MANILMSVGTYRDGGSISATYVCKDLFCHRTLFFQINRNSIDWEHGAYFRQFEYAEQWEYHRFEWTSKITGAVLDDSFDCKLRVSWATAGQILRELAPQKARLPKSDQELFDEMTIVAHSEGTGRWVVARNRDPST